MSSLKHAFRRLSRAPVFTALTLLTLAIGIGANTAVFSVIEGVLIKPLPYLHSEALVGLWHMAPGLTGMGDKLDMSPSLYFTYREENKTFQEIGTFKASRSSVTGIGEPEQVRTLIVTYGTLQALGVQPIQGRWFSQEDDMPGRPETVMLGFGYWQKRFGGDPSAVGRTLNVDSKLRTVIGVMPSSFRFIDDDPEQLILPQQFDRNKTFLGDFSYRGVGRLRPGVTIDQASADVSRMLGIWLNSWSPPPGFSRALFANAHLGPKLQAFKQDVVGDVGATLWVLMGTIGLVLLIACANVANLLLVRAEGRQQELAIRAALGAGWSRIAQELLLESLVLGIMGGVFGLVLSYGALRILVVMGPATLPRLHEIGIDPLVLAFTLAISLFAGLIFGMIPVLKYAVPNLTPAIRGNRTMSHSRERHRTRNSLAVIQVGLALVLLVGSGLMIRTFEALHNVDPGFTRPREIQLLRISIQEAQVEDADRVMRMQNEMLDKLAAIPGVVSAAFGSTAPLEGFTSGDILFAEDKSYAEGQVPPVRRFRWVSPGYFTSLGIPILAGRDYNWTDLYQKRDVGIVSENLAREFWGTPDAAIGKRIREDPTTPWHEVIGVVADIRDDSMQEPAPKLVYWPALMGRMFARPVFAIRTGTFVIRTTRAGTESLLADARQAIWSMNPNLPVFLVRTMQEVYSGSMARTSFTLVMLAIAGGMALILGVVGIYGVIAYSVSQRTREIGIRMALGAESSGLKRMFVRYGLVLAGIGASLGLAAALAMTRWMSSLLFGVTAFDPICYVLGLLLLLSCAALASYIPARRAVRVDPVESLRAE